MKILIVGAGEVGFNLAKVLSSEEHDVVVVDIDEEKISRVRERLDVMTVRGSGSRLGVLEKAGVGADVDMIIAVANSDETNIVSCMFGKKRGVPTTVARMRDLRYSDKDATFSHKELGIDFVVSPERVISEAIVELLALPSAIQVAYFFDGNLRMYGVNVREGHMLENMKLKDFGNMGWKGVFLVAVVVRDGKSFIPRGDDVILKGDKVFVLGKTADFDRFKKEVKSVMIVGSGKVGFRVARSLSMAGVPFVKVIDVDREKCQKVAMELHNVVVLNGDGTDLEFLIKEGVSEVDGFVTTTRNDEVNLLSAVLGKSAGAKKSIALVRKIDYMNLLPYLSIDSIVNPRVDVTSAILRFIRRRGFVNGVYLEGVDVQALELAVSQDAPIVGKNLSELKGSQDFIVGAIMRDKNVFIPKGDDCIWGNDRVIVFAPTSKVGKVEKLFVG
ncbi:MAG: Trk system potassium transporter TrkA [Synergistetes bacterium]|nr:Trk system potassium transporter TrkA [Synergistota bacterium]